MKLGIGLGKGPDAAAAARDAVRQAKATCPKPTLALAFGSISLDQKKVHAALCRELDPNILLGGSSYAEITPAGVTKGTVAVLLADLGVAPRFAQTALGKTSRDTGVALLDALGGRPCTGGLPLGLLFSSFSDGHENDTLGVLSAGAGRFPLFGGLCCGDYDKGMAHPKFRENYQYLGPRLTKKGARLALLDLPKKRFAAAFGFEHGWDCVGPDSVVTKADGACVSEVDGIPVLDYYRQFMGERTSGDFFELLVQRFGFALELEGAYAGLSLMKLPVVVDCKAGKITFAPSEPLQGRRVRLTLASRRGLVEGATRAARRCRAALGGKKPALVLAVSCCTRNAILHSRMELEIEAVRAVFGPEVPVFGFYAGGEIMPFLSRYKDVVEPGRPFAGSYYHTTTLGLMALACDDMPRRVAAPECGQCAPTTAKEEIDGLRALLERSETVLDDSEAFLANLSRKSYEDTDKLRKQAAVLHRYTPHDVWRKIGRNAERGRYEIADAEFQGAFLFMDVKGFTAYSETHKPPEVVAALNEIFGPATEIIRDCGGTVDKFIGDCVFAAFPRPAGAVAAAQKLLRLVAGLCAAGSPFAVRIGVNAGRAVRANVGGPDRREYTYIGDAVNTAQRLEAACAPGRAMVAAGLEAPARRRFKTVTRRSIAAKGKAEPVDCFECSL